MAAVAGPSRDEYDLVVDPEQLLPIADNILEPVADPSRGGYVHVVRVLKNHVKNDFVHAHAQGVKNDFVHAQIVSAKFFFAHAQTHAQTLI